MPTLGKLLQMPESVRTYEDSPLLALRKCMTGLEFEAENVKSPLPIEEEESGFWEQKEDGSLRGASMEYVLREPLFGNDLIKAVTWLCDWATKQRLESNYRTGLHVHIDVRNLDTAQLVTMLTWYAVYEKLIFNWVANDREGSIFCMPFYKAEAVLEQVVLALNSKELMRDRARNIDRYAGFNLNALSRFGTVEWRHMQTTFNAERVIKWINIAQGFKKYAKANPLKPKELLGEISRNGADRIFAGIVGPSLAAEMWQFGANKCVWDVGIPVAQEIATLLDSGQGLQWDTVRSVLGTGDNPRWNKWAKKQTENQELNKPPENPFADPELLKDHAIQKEAVDSLTAHLRQALDNFVVPAAYRPVVPPPAREF